MVVRTSGDPGCRSRLLRLHRARLRSVAASAIDLTHMVSSFIPSRMMASPIGYIVPGMPFMSIVIGVSHSSRLPCGSRTAQRSHHDRRRALHQHGMQRRRAVGQDRPDGNRRIDGRRCWSGESRPVYQPLSAGRESVRSPGPAGPRTAVRTHRRCRRPRPVARRTAGRLSGVSTPSRSATTPFTRPCGTCAPNRRHGSGCCTARRPMRWRARGRPSSRPAACLRPRLEVAPVDRTRRRTLDDAYRVERRCVGEVACGPGS